MNYALNKIVIDTNVWVSAALFPRSASAQSVMAALEVGTVFRSEDTYFELLTVLNRSKFDRYFPNATYSRAVFLSMVEQHTRAVRVVHLCVDCIDPKDNMFLSLARSANADVIVSGDKAHVLAMHPYKGIAIVSPAEFLQKVQER